MAPLIINVNCLIRFMNKIFKKLLRILCINAIIIYGLAYLFFGRFPIDNQLLFSHITGLETVIVTIFSINFLLLHKIKRKSTSYKIFKWLSVISMSLMFTNYLFYIFLGISPSTNVSSSMLFDLATAGIDLSPIFAMLALIELDRGTHKC